MPNGHGVTILPPANRCSHFDGFDSSLVRISLCWTLRSTHCRQKHQSHPFHSTQPVRSPRPLRQDDNDPRAKGLRGWDAARALRVGTGAALNHSKNIIHLVPGLPRSRGYLFRGRPVTRAARKSQVLCCLTDRTVCNARCRSQREVSTRSRRACVSVEAQRWGVGAESSTCFDRFRHRFPVPVSGTAPCVIEERSVVFSSGAEPEERRRRSAAAQPMR